MLSDHKNLKKKRLKPPYRDEGWSLENVRDGLEYFKEVNGHYPTSREVDNFEYLPTARTLQRSFGRIVKVRKSLNLSGPHQFSKGKTRSLKAQEADKRARAYETEFFYFLNSKIEEIRIHEHKVLRPGDVSCDFFVYTTEKEGVVLDLFYAADILNVANILNIKYKRYLNVVHPIIFIIVGNENIDQAALDKMVKNRRSSLPNTMRIMTETHFKSNFDKIIV